MSTTKKLNSLNGAPDQDDFARYEIENPAPPVDRWSGCYLIFLMLGVGGMWPWNGFLTAFDYFFSLFPNLPSFQFIMSIVFNIATVTFQFLGVAFGNKIPLTARILITFVPFTIVMVLVPFVREMVDGSSERLGIVLALVFVSGMSTAVGFNCVIGLASQFPPEYVGAVMTGQGIAGVAVGLIRIITKASYGDTPNGINTATMLYFLLAAGVEVVCIVLYFVLLCTNFARYHMAKATSGNSSKMDDETESLLAGGTGKDGVPKQVSVLAVLKKILLMGFTVWSVFFVTLSLFPGMTSLVHFVPTDFPRDAAWFGICNIFIFQVFDFIGRILPRWLVIIPARVLWIFSVGRVVFGVLFILCIIPNEQPIFNSNWASFVIMMAFALTNGYFGTLAMMYGPNNVEDHEKDTAGMIMSVFLQLGIFSAVLFALFILYLVQPCALPDFLMPSYVVCKNTTNGTVAAVSEFLFL